ncbi:MAG TPA: hypothetical protein VGV59_15925 [Pyrinomonadaceae bacterium]|nr:hypothetical protein [Pyrinomonadaceae bacterium]
MKRFGKIQTLTLAAVVSAVTLAAPSTQAQTRGSQRREDRQERREDRQERREERREDRQERREERRGRNWERYGQYGGSFQLRQTALNAGYNEGIQEGRRDRSRGERFDYRDESDYRNATIDYSSRLGNRALYQRYFREGFANGYEDGYRGY